ncbi:MAG: hypothetical protein JSS76_12130 [Bacteroidetes bacterium]|nr:hypothetical protein [Bacteroidota bacterium]
MKNSIIAGVVLLITALGAASCRKDIYGCTDPYASNYAPNANVDNGSCTYVRYGNVMFWTDRNEGTVQITIGGQTSTITGYVTGGTPSCGNTVSANFSLEEGTYTYNVVAGPSPAYPQGYTYTGTAVAQNGICNAYQL